MTRKYPMFQEPQREDPVLKGEIHKVLVERGARAKIALEHLKKAKAAIDSSPYSILGDDAIFERTQHEISMAIIRVQGDVDWLNRSITDTYLSNKAVDKLGQQIEQDIGLNYDHI